MTVQSPALKRCTQCGYEWTPRKQEPRSCPYCHSYKWQQPKQSKEVAQ